MVMTEDISGPLSYLEEGRVMRPLALPHWPSGSDFQAYQSQWESHPGSR